MHESERDLAELQALLDGSYRAAGPHLLSVHTQERRLDARQVTERLEGMCLLALATVTADNRPIVGPVDGIFYRGSFYFGSSPQSVRLRHLGTRPQVSATHVPGEHLAVTIHGSAKPVDLTDEQAAGFRQTLLAIYVPRYGSEWEHFMDSSRYMRIVAERMFAFGTSPR
jgi:nitroimidazol reductase NimA-like FMN-containing flavoprotein (pyridoxamine 5'-phosphate oxidase superfamily)